MFCGHISASGKHLVKIYQIMMDLQTCFNDTLLFTTSQTTSKSWSFSIEDRIAQTESTLSSSITQIVMQMTVVGIEISKSFLILSWSHRHWWICYFHSNACTKDMWPLVWQLMWNGNCLTMRAEQKQSCVLCPFNNTCILLLWVVPDPTTFLRKSVIQHVTWWYN